MLVAHADWGVDPKKRWVATARRSHRGWTADDVQPVGIAGTLATRLHAADDERVIAGFDFPIGIPRAYARAAGISRFTDFLHLCGTGDWQALFNIADAPDEISLHQPFYPRTYLPKGAKKRAHLTDALGLPFDDLLRRCERAQPTRNAACSLFWTCGGNQVGKGALSGWRLLQAEPSERLNIWPFDGALSDLADKDGIVVAETYPAEFTHHLGLGRVNGKRRQDVRRQYAPALLDAAQHLGVSPLHGLEQRVRDGFGTAAAGEDQFDAFIGLLGMINVVDGRRPPGDPHDDPAIHTVEGWILGQEAQPGER